MYVETDFLTALVKEDDWLRGPATRALDENEDLHTSVLAYAELLVLFYDRERADFDIDAPRAITNLLELVSIRPERHEEAVLVAATYLDEHEMTPFDALHAGMAVIGDGSVLSSERDYDEVGLERVPLETYGDAEPEDG